MQIFTNNYVHSELKFQQFLFLLLYGEDFDFIATVTLDDVINTLIIISIWNQVLSYNLVLYRLFLQFKFLRINKQ